MSLQRVIADLGLDPDGVDHYLSEARFARTIGRRIDPTAIRHARRSWPSRFTTDYTPALEHVRTALAPFIEEDE